MRADAVPEEDAKELGQILLSYGFERSPSITSKMAEVMDKKPLWWVRDTQSEDNGEDPG